MQIHNLVDWQTHLPTLRAWKDEGRIRLLGITHYTESAHGELEAVLKPGGFDFVQVELRARRSRRRAQPAAVRRRTTASRCWSTSRSAAAGCCASSPTRKLPDWAGEIGCTSWAQILLKFVLANRAVTCVIPGTGKPEHMRDNVQAGLGVYPDAAMLQRMVREIAI